MRRSQKIRVKSTEVPRLFGEGQSISRHQAISRIQEHLDAVGLHPEALRLIQLFNIDAEELSEAGLSYESLKALEQRAAFI